MDKESRTKKRKKKKKMRTYLKYAFLAGLGLSALVLGIFFIWVATLKIPDINDFSSRTVTESSKIYDRTGQVVLYDVFREERRTVVAYEEISEAMKLSVLAIEDDEFFNHSGVRFMAMLNAVIQKIMNPEQRLRGGSTITQQVIKNALLTNDRAISRKIKEIVLAWRLENKLSKEEILEVYLNEIAFGGSIYGVQQASQSFFGKDASGLTIAESAYLAAIPKAPTFYSPYGSNTDRLEGRKNFIINRMGDLGFISETERNAALEEQVDFVVRNDTGIKAPHFVFYVREYLEEKYGAELLERGGLEIYTTLDWGLQQEVEQIAAEQAVRVSEQFQASNLGLVALENETGQVLAMIGSKDYFAEDIDGKFNIATAYRQPGSTFKPFVYAAAFDKGYLPETVVWDVKTEFSASCYPDGKPLLPEYADRCYQPQNYDQRFRGPISFRSALAQSLNIPAVKALYLVGIGDAIEYAKKLGITGLDRAPRFYGLNLVLGGGEVRLLDMVSAYGTFGAGGERSEPTGILRVVGGDGEVLEEYEQKQNQVMSADVAALINDVLSDNDAKRPMFGQNSVLYYENRDVAVKTGTTNNFRDFWTVGYTPEYSLGVWVGNNDNTPMGSFPSSTVAAPFWRASMDELLDQYTRNRSEISFDIPNVTVSTSTKPILRGSWQGDTAVEFDTKRGVLADENSDPADIKEIVVPDYHSILHWVNKSDPRGEVPINPGSDSQYEYWEYGVSQWSGVNNLSIFDQESLDLLGSLLEREDAAGGRTESDRKTEDDFVLDISITSPVENATYAADDKVFFSIDVSRTSGIQSYYYYINNSFISSGGRNEKSTDFTPSRIRDIRNIGNVAKVVVELTNGERIEREVVFDVE